jgi:hypothetical protein
LAQQRGFIEKFLAFETAFPKMTGTFILPIGPPSNRFSHALHEPTDMTITLIQLMLDLKDISVEAGGPTTQMSLRIRIFLLQRAAKYAAKVISTPTFRTIITDILPRCLDRTPYSIILVRTASSRVVSPSG